MLTLSTTTIRAGAAILAISTLTSVVKAQEFMAGHLFASSKDAHEIVEYDAAGARLRTFGAGAGLSNPFGLAFGPNGHLYVASYGNDAIVEFDGSGAAVKTINGIGEMDGPYAIAFGPNGNLYVACYDNDHLVELSPAGTIVKDIPLPYTDQPSGVALSPEGNIYVTGDASGNIVELDPEGVHLRVVKGAITDCRGIVWLGDGNLHVGGLSGGTRRILKVSLTGSIVDSWTVGNALICGLAVGPDGAIYVAPNKDDTIYATDPSSEAVNTKSGGGTSERLLGLAFAPQRFQAKLTGKIARQGVDPKSINESCTVSMSPFSSWVMIQLADDVVNPDDLATIFGAGAMVLQGRSVAAKKLEKQLFVGAQAGRKVLANGMAAAQLTLQLAETSVDTYSLKKLLGAICRDSGDVTFTGKLSTSKKLN